MIIWRRTFLRHLEEQWGNVSEACRLTGVSRWTVYDLYAKNECFRREWDDIKAALPTRHLEKNGPEHESSTQAR